MLRVSQWMKLMSLDYRRGGVQKPLLCRGFCANVTMLWRVLKFESMPFKKQKSGKYKSPSGRAYTKKQVAAYYAKKKKKK